MIRFLLNNNVVFHAYFYFGNVDFHSIKNYFFNIGFSSS